MMLSKTGVGEDTYSASPAASINRPGSLHTAHGHGASLRVDLARHDLARKLDASGTSIEQDRAREPDALAAS
jgi:hypothetical protein